MRTAVIHLLSADHRTHGLDVVARLGGVAPHLGTDLLDALPQVEGVVVLGTCNRLTLLLDAPARPGPIEAVTAFLAERAGLDDAGSTARPLTLTSRSDRQAVAEVFATAAGLESMVVGEREIAGQLRRAMVLAQGDGTLTGALARLIEHASAASRRVATSTGLAGAGRSVVGVGLDLAAGRPGATRPLEGVRVLLVGTGAYAGASVTALRERGARQIHVYSRSDRAQAFAQGHDLQAVPADGLPQALRRADLVVSCRGLGQPVLTRALLDQATQGRAAAPGTGGAPGPLTVLDLALTRDVARDAATVPGVRLIDLAAVQAAVPRAQAEQVEAARALIAQEVDDYCRLDEGRRMAPLIAGLRRGVEQLVAEEVTRLRRGAATSRPVLDARAGVAQVGPEMVSLAEAQRALNHLAARLLHHPSVAARRAGEDGRAQEYLTALPLVLGGDVVTGLLGGHDAPATCPVHREESRD